MHFVNRDSLSLANDFLSLGFIPEGVDVHSVSDALKVSFADRTGESQDFQVCFSFYTPFKDQFLLCNSCSWCSSYILVISLSIPKQNFENFKICC